MTNKEAQVYLHIPFCVRKCAYCDFLSYPAGEDEIAVYIRSLLKEIAASAGESKGKHIRSVFFGGGTPSILSAETIEDILNMVFRCFSVKPDAEITLECNPGTTDRKKLLAIRSAGVNRLSVGAQSLNDELLRTIGRIHDKAAIIRTVEDARTAGFDNVSIDLISALPGQTRKDWTDTLQEAASLSPEHISAYSLILEEGTPLYERRSSFGFPDEEEERAMYYDTADILSKHGFLQYEISNYAKPGFSCIHNIGYWTGFDYMGLGLGASSFMDGVRYKNTEDPKEYIRFCEEPKEQRKEVEKLSLTDQMAEFVILGLRMTQGISTVEFESRFGIAIENAYPGVVKKYTGLGMLKTENERLMFTREGVSVSNTVMAEFI